MKSLSESTIQTIKAVTPAVAPHVETITANFYQRMFKANPEVRAFFNAAHQRSGRQPVALAQSVAAYFSNIDRLEVLAPAIELIAQKHCSLGVQPEHYPIVGRHLLDAIAEVMGDAVTDDVVVAVTEAYTFLADICIERERQIYESQAGAEGGWNGYRSFTVDRKVIESDEVISFYLKPTDQKPLPMYRPGQYITVKVDLKETPTAPRNYSLSHRPGNDFFRISVKREPAAIGGVPAGLVSNHLHDSVQSGDELQIGPPCGEFTMSPALDDATPFVFLAGGIGITPLLSMLHAQVAANVDRSLCLIHACRSEAVQAFRNEVTELETQATRLSTYSLFETSETGEGHGRLTQAQLQEWTATPSAEYFCCGPPAFLQHVTGLLAELGVQPSRQHLEFFGPKQPLER